VLQWLQTALWEGHKVRTIRRTLSEVATSAKLDAQGGLSLGGIPVAVAYYRAGYSPDDYAGPEEWRARQGTLWSHAHPHQTCCLSFGAAS